MYMKRALIVTVGTGTRPDVDIVRPLVKTIKDSRPDFLVMAVTAASREHGERIAKELGIREDKDEFQMVTLEGFDDFQRVFRDLNEVHRDLARRGYSPEEIQLDFTSGTKAMSSGAVCSAIYNQCQSFKYVTGDRRNGVVVDDTERFLSFSPNEIYALHDMKLAQTLIYRLRFATAAEILSNINRRTISPCDQQEVQDLMAVTRVYRAWDLFDHATAINVIKTINWGSMLVREFQPGEAALDLLNRLGSSSTGETGDLLVDLYNNSIRRGIEGKYDDAVARLYRAVELLAQSILNRTYGIKSNDVDLTLIPDTMRSTLEQHRSEDGVIRIGLVLNYKVLAALGDPVGAHFMSSDRLQGRLKERNVSILAHGTTPVSKRLFKSLLSDVCSLIQVSISDFSNRSGDCQFPWLGAENRD